MWRWSHCCSIGNHEHDEEILHPTLFGRKGSLASQSCCEGFLIGFSLSVCIPAVEFLTLEGRVCYSALVLRKVFDVSAQQPKYITPHPFRAPKMMCWLAEIVCLFVWVQTLNVQLQDDKDLFTEFDKKCTGFESRTVPLRLLIFQKDHYNITAYSDLRDQEVQGECRLSLDFKVTEHKYNGSQFM